MPYEPTIKKNPQQLAIKQHFHTAHAISLFYDSDKKVEVMELSSGEIVQRHKRAKIFCTKRTWDQQAETGYMARIENAFHKEIDHVKAFSERNHEAISKYCLLWRLRHEYHLSDPIDSVLNGVSGSGLTKEQEEILESKGMGFIREGGVVPSRFTTSIQIQTILDRDWGTCRHFKWGLIEAQDGEFIVADGYGDFAFIPISPKKAFWAGQDDQIITRQQLAEVNKESVSRAKQYYFARKISECPIA
ncbi:hypothetical protein ACI7YQ_19780 (plasmid) [Alteromonas marina]|uniref:hypothetical protein n=1 Tax=Alteromonas sp. KUL150 TaxID=2480805 RepID=UPI0012E5A2F8|nr:hypothetical protein [Alteromonas sp. KUL150]GFD73853.1 hypothetical protein KUL113_32730 [Tenacibaculum sp. KUL113]GFD86846.1 hypothetical protein KUL150_29050 [Alteromonas sp. KUL150]